MSTNSNSGQIDISIALFVFAVCVFFSFFGSNRANPEDGPFPNELRKTLDLQDEMTQLDVPQAIYLNLTEKHKNDLTSVQTSSH